MMETVKQRGSIVDADTHVHARTLSLFTLHCVVPSTVFRCENSGHGPVTAACSGTWVASICHCVPHRAGEEVGNTSRQTVCLEGACLYFSSRNTYEL